MLAAFRETTTQHSAHEQTISCSPSAIFPSPPRLRSVRHLALRHQHHRRRSRGRATPPRRPPETPTSTSSRARRFHASAGRSRPWPMPRRNGRRLRRWWAAHLVLRLAGVRRDQRGRPRPSIVAEGEEQRRNAAAIRSSSRCCCWRRRTHDVHALTATSRVPWLYRPMGGRVRGGRWAQGRNRGRNSGHGRGHGWGDTREWGLVSFLSNARLTPPDLFYVMHLFYNKSFKICKCLFNLYVLQKSLSDF